MGMMKRDIGFLFMVPGLCNALPQGMKLAQYKKIICLMDADGLGPLLLIWFNFNPGMDK